MLSFQNIFSRKILVCWKLPKTRPTLAGRGAKLWVCHFGFTLTSTCNISINWFRLHRDVSEWDPKVDQNWDPSAVCPLWYRFKRSIFEYFLIWPDGDRCALGQRNKFEIFKRSLQGISRECSPNYRTQKTFHFCLLIITESDEGKSWGGGVFCRGLFLHGTIDGCV